jgi:hypothetical protein
MAEIVRGSCLCGAVAWEAAGPFQMMSHCHCSRCRKVHGTAFGTYVMSPAEGFRILRGRDDIRTYRSSAALARPFCGRCGSVVPDGEPWEGFVQMPAGALDDDPGVRPLAHIFAASKAPWWEIRDALPRFDAYPPGVDFPVLDDLPARAPESEKPRGSCLCGDVAYVVNGSPLRVVICHCSRCRKAQAAAHATTLWTEGDPVHFTRGESSLATYRVPGAQFFHQVFCRRCGSTMPRNATDLGYSFVPMGTLDDDPGLRAAGHIFVGSKAPWYELPDDGLPRWEEMPPAPP